jgi:UDP-N-acetylglucosamine 3-dehydrogenase
VPQRPVRVGVVGVGMMGYHHARVYYEFSREGVVELVGVADVNWERARRVAEQFHTKPFRDPFELLREGVDAVSIAVPTSLHRDVALSFIEGGVHVLVEKPIADTVEKALDIIRAAEKNGVVLLVGHIERFNPAVQKLKQLMSRGELGSPITVSAKRVGPFSPRVADVGVTVDLAVHDIDVMAFLLEEYPSRVYARARNILETSNTEDYALILLTFPDEVDGVIETNRLTPYKARKLTVVGTKAIAELDYLSQDLKVYDEDFVKQARVEREEPLKRELRHFINCVRGVEKPLVTGWDGLKALKVALAAVESAAKGVPVAIEYGGC